MGEMWDFILGGKVQVRSFCRVAGLTRLEWKMGVDNTFVASMPRELVDAIMQNENSMPAQSLQRQPQP